MDQMGLDGIFYLFTGVSVFTLIFRFVKWNKDILFWPSRQESTQEICIPFFSEIALYALDVYYNQTYLNQSSK